MPIGRALALAALAALAIARRPVRIEEEGRTVEVARGLWLEATPQQGLVNTNLEGEDDDITAGRLEKIRANLFLQGGENRSIPKIVHLTVFGGCVDLNCLCCASTDQPTSTAAAGTDCPLSTAIDKYRSLNPDYELRVYDLAKAEDYMRKMPDGERLVSAFRHLRPYTFRSDLFRYAALKNEGGWYADASLDIQMPFSKIAPDPTTRWFSARDRGNDLMLTGFLGSAPNQPWVGTALAKSVENIENKRYPHEKGSHSDLYVTGPGVLGEAMGLTDLPASLKGDPSVVIAGLVEDPGHDMYHIETSNAVNHRAPGFEDEKVKSKSFGCGNTYGDLYQARQVYIDDAEVAQVANGAGQPRLVEEELAEHQEAAPANAPVKAVGISHIGRKAKRTLTLTQQGAVDKVKVDDKADSALIPSHFGKKGRERGTQQGAADKVKVLKVDDMEEVLADLDDAYVRDLIGSYRSDGSSKPDLSEEDWAVLAAHAYGTDHSSRTREPSKDHQYEGAGGPFVYTIGETDKVPTNEQYREMAQWTGREIQGNYGVPTQFWTDMQDALNHCLIDSGSFIVAFGDDTAYTFPVLSKARRNSNDAHVSILPVLGLERHMQPLQDLYMKGGDIGWGQKNDTLVWRGATTGGDFRTYSDHSADVPFIYSNRAEYAIALFKENHDVKFTNDVQGMTWMADNGMKGEPMTREELLKHKYLLALEGNDVSTGIKWMLASNSVVVMPRPTMEDLSLQSKLKAGVHYVELESSSPEHIRKVMSWLKDNDDEAHRISQAANAYMKKVYTHMEHASDYACPILRDHGNWFECQKAKRSAPTAHTDEVTQVANGAGQPRLVEEELAEHQEAAPANAPVKAVGISHIERKDKRERLTQQGAVDKVKVDDKADSALIPSHIGRKAKRERGTQQGAADKVKVDDMEEVLAYNSIFWFGPIWNACGYGEEARTYLQIMSSFGVDVGARHFGDVRFDDTEIAGVLHDDKLQSLKGLELLPIAKPGIVVCHSGAGNWWVEGRPEVECPPYNTRDDPRVLKVGRTMWETDGLPDGWIDAVKKMDEMWVPSKWQLESFVNLGVDRSKLWVLPEAVLTEDLFNPENVATPFDLPLLVNPDRMLSLKMQLLQVFDHASMVNGGPSQAESDYAIGDRDASMLIQTGVEKSVDKPGKKTTGAPNVAELAAAPAMGPIVTPIVAMERTEIKNVAELAAAPVGSYKFLTVGKWEWRKGTELLIEAFCTEFSRQDEVVLYIKTMGRSNDDMDGILTRIAEKLGKEYKELPRLGLISTLLSDDERPTLYAAVDAFVLPTRGEGWGLPPAEAMSMGLPTIATSWSGITEFVTEGVSLPLKYELETFTEDNQFGMMGVKKGQHYAEPSCVDLQKKMRWLMEHPDEGKEIGKRAREHMRERFSPAVVGNLLEEHIKQILPSFRTTGTAPGLS